ncbi:hypothetical protein [Streptomyces sp. NPDC048340]|uniref:hypothetical protein n=1 Tax=Streptomyces sp. NPDC048340 TaxID=3365537 RepID=UPI0037204306
MSQFLLTRVVEVAVHGLDLADALGREPWLTAAAGDAVVELLVGSEQMAAAGQLGWSRPYFLRRATGREPLQDAEAALRSRISTERDRLISAGQAWSSSE